jgi:hypothetical protein
MSTVTGTAPGGDEGPPSPFEALYAEAPYAEPLDDELWYRELRAAPKVYSFDIGTVYMYSTDDTRYGGLQTSQGWPPYGSGEPTATGWWIDSTGRRKPATVVAPEMARIAAENPIREHPPVRNRAADTASTPSSEESAQADAYTDVLAGDWSQAESSLGRRRRWANLRGYWNLARGAEAPGRHRREREVVLSPRLLTGAAVILAGQKRSAVDDEWRSHLSDLKSQGLSSRDQTHAALGFLWAALRYRLRDAANLAWHSVDAVLRSRTLSNLFVTIPTLMAAICLLRYLGMLGVLTSAEGISAIGGGLYGLVRVGRWWRDVKPPEPKARRVKEQ